MNVFWSDIESRFFKLHSEQRSANGLVHAINCDDSWTLGGPEDLQQKFRSIVRNIAVRLGWANDKDPLSVWCELQKRHGVGYHKMTGRIDRRRFELDTEQMCSIEREQRDTQGGTIDLLCKVSAEYCIECDTKEAAAEKATAAGRQIFAAENSGKIAQAESRSNKHSKPLEVDAQQVRSLTKAGVGKTAEPSAKRGPPADINRHRAIADVVRSHGPNWKGSSNLEQIADELGKRKISTSPAWAKRERPAKSWERAVELYPELVRKALAYSLQMAAKDTNRKPSQTLANSR